MMHIHHIKRLILYNLLTVPFISLVYLPYYVFVIHYSLDQFKAWIITGAVVATFANTLIQPYISRVVRFLDGRYPKTKIAHEDHEHLEVPELSLDSPTQRHHK